MQVKSSKKKVLTNADLFPSESLNISKIGNSLSKLTFHHSDCPWVSLAPVELVNIEAQLM